MTENLLPILRERYPEFFPALRFVKLGVCQDG